MARRIRNFLTITSLLLCLTATAFWIRGYRSRDFIGYSASRWTTHDYVNYSRGLFSGGGRFTIINSCAPFHGMNDAYHPAKWATLAPDARDRFTKFRADHPESTTFFHSTPLPST